MNPVVLQLEMRPVFHIISLMVDLRHYQPQDRTVQKLALVTQYGSMLF